MSSAAPARRTANLKLGSALRALLTAACGFLICPSTGQAWWFCSYNLRNWLVQPGRSPEQSIHKPETEKRLVVELLRDLKPDVIGLCEIGGASDLEDLQARLAKQGLPLPHHYLTQGGDPHRKLALLSRFPVVATATARELDYRLEGRSWRMQRGILDVSIQPEGGPMVRCVGVHLKSMREVSDADQSLMRRHEAKLLRSHLDEVLRENPQRQLLCYGDFNDHLNSPTLRSIVGPRNSPSHLLMLDPLDSRGESWTQHWAAAGVYSRFDYVLATRSLKPHVANLRVVDDPRCSQASDHRPVMVEISP
jgi:endonuclease/exonuclease/phosphatase family metal-dependent hydrolase